VAPRSEPQHGLADAIRELRTKREWSQEELAHRAGLTTGAVNAIEGARSNPTWATVKSIAAALDVSLSRLAGLAEKLDRN
jgi:transcriptional regulator with XRE-family HTH domain